jgi:aminoglycoside phosphotransferase (APT) family kinase protein
MSELTPEEAQRIIGKVAPGHRVVSVVPAAAAYTNSVQILCCATPDGNELRLVLKRMTEEPDPARATADFHGLRIARRHGIPAPEPIYLDATGELLGWPGLVSGCVEGQQIARPKDPVAWSKDLARLLLRIHTIGLDTDDRSYLYDGNDLGLYFLSDHWPEKMAGHPLSDEIYDAVRELRHDLCETPAVFLHMDYWPGNILWHEGRISAVLDWDAASFGDPALDVGYFRMNMYLRGLKEAADPFLACYEAEAGPVRNLGCWELACAARPLPWAGFRLPSTWAMKAERPSEPRATTPSSSPMPSAGRMPGVEQTGEIPGPA